MNYYILPIIINDRREVTLQLQGQDRTTENRYIVEVPENVHFNLFSMLKDADIRTFIPGTSDITIGSLSPSYILEGQTLTISLKVKPAPVAAAPQEPENKEAAPAALTYDDLDTYKPEVKKAAPQFFDAPVQSETSNIGYYGDCIAITANNYSNGAFNVLGNIGNRLETIHNSTFPDLKIIVTLEVGDQIYTSSFILSFAHPDQFLGMALDFGSESSQLAVKRYQSGFGYQEKKPEHENLFRNIYAFHKAKGWISKEDNSSYYQEEENTNFYKSIFFLKEDLTGDYEDIEKELFIQNMPENLKMMVNSSSRDSGFVTLTENRFHQLPNLKITHKYVDVFSRLNFNINKEGYDINVNLGEVKNKTYNSILNVIIESFLKKEFIKYSTAQRKIRFILLVPNIYDYADIRHTQQLLHKIFNDFAQHEYKDKILAWEILTISESDASFLGYINKNDVHVQKDSDYIIVDAGKGTTDFSVIRTGKDNLFNIKPTYRNGFAGAGNMITFAIFETVLHYIRANADNQHTAFKFIKEQVLRNLTDSNLEIKNRLYKELERLKYNYNDNNGYALNQWTNARSGDFNFRNITEAGSDINTLIDLLAQIENISDFYGYVEETCKLIAQRVVSNLKMIKDNKEDFNCGGIVLTGRGFLFKPLERELRACIQTQLQLSENWVHTLSGTELKDVCIKGVFNNTVRLNTERIGYPIQIIVMDRPKSTPEAKAEATEDKKKTSFGNRLINIFFNELNDIENAKAVLTTEKAITYNSLYKSQILIGAKRFKVSSSSIYDNQHEAVDADIIFTPQGYLVRQLEHNVVKHILTLSEIFDHDKVEMNMVVPSLFPNYIDEQYIYSIRRDDIRKAPIMPPPPFSGQGPNPSTYTVTPNKPKGPQYF
ncbi:hypothetical protein DBR32_06225 [Taibaiella sp. KBW10]|uniref:hypothetical protein n=1 Tax=Taibaiella sp. KBW10 TaxID=2153357 RepID=UPI000F59DCC4|nr:hypothetical protein [Taibaiella sp. KBW10]RQO31551.1 hypothetical protein DBR32_06225 [Taibaiella sp. KBW10]